MEEQSTSASVGELGALRMDATAGEAERGKELRGQIEQGGHRLTELLCYRKWRFEGVQLRLL